MYCPNLRTVLKQFRPSKSPRRSICAPPVDVDAILRTSDAAPAVDQPLFAEAPKSSTPAVQRRFM